MSLFEATQTEKQAQDWLRMAFVYICNIGDISTLKTKVNRFHEKNEVAMDQMNIFQ